MNLRSSIVARYDHAMTALRRAGWPAWSAAAIFAFSLLGLLGAYALQLATGDWQSRAAAVKAQRRTLVIAAPSARVPPLQRLAAPADQQTDDIRDLFQLAERFEIRINAAQYEAPDLSAPEFIVRKVNLRMREEYPAVKTYLEAVLANAPHAYIANLGLERADPAKRDVNVSLTLALVYAVSASPASGARLP